MQRLTLSFLFFCNAAFLYGQSMDSILLLKPVEISAFRNQNFSFANHIEKPDSTILSNATSKNLSQLLNEQGSFFVKSYGTQSATLSCRGTGTAHNVITWNGIPLSNPMLGLNDFSLVPVQFFNYIELNSGNNCTLQGSGAAGSSIEVGVKPDFTRGTNFSATKTIGSYGLNYTGLGASVHSGKFYCSTQVFHQNSTNNFQFVNTTQLRSPEQELHNNSVVAYGISSDFFYKPGHGQLFSIHGWFQNDIREIPPSMLQTLSLASQNDMLKRVAASWQKEFSKLTWIVKSALSNEILDYRDPMINLISIGKFTNWVSMTEVHFQLGGQFYFSSGLNNIYTTALANEYHEQKTRNTLDIYSGCSYQSKNKLLHIGLTGRETLQDITNNPVNGSLSLEEKVSRSISFTQLIATIYRTPTLNDLYWIPGGNEKLNPESGWNAEMGFRFNKTSGNYKASISNHVFTYFLHDLIVWQPGRGGYWSPQNINSVWSRGSELEGKLSYKIHETELQLMAAACYTLATNETEDGTPAGFHKQLPYTPELVLRSSFTANLRNWNFRYTHSFTSLTYITSDNKTYLPEYDLPGLHISRKIFINETSKCIQLGLDIYNLSDQSYQVIANRPMPGRTFEFTFKLTI